MSYEQESPDQIARLQRAVQTAAESLAPEITLYGLAQPHTLEIDPEKFSNMLDTRLRVERAIAHLHREADTRVGGWSWGEGLYRKWEDDWNDERAISEQPLVRKEIEIAKTIDELLKQRDSEKPVFALDFGGGLGLSWMRLAAQAKYRAAVEEGRLAMVVTNLGATPYQLPDEDGYLGIARSMNYADKLGGDSPFGASYLKEDFRWAQENQGYVHYLDANALELASHSINLPNGPKVSLLGNVDIIHEHFALAHTHVPDLALASFGELLSSQGTLYSDAATYYHMMHPELFSAISLENGKIVSITEEYSYQRRLALAIGSKLLQQQGFSYRLHGADTMHSIGVFSRLPNADN